MVDIKKVKLPDNPGVYFFKRGGEILYIGKATSLKDRVRSYFNGDIMASRGPRIVAMLELADSVDFQPTDSVLEALILEAALIKKHQPKYNAKEKDGKSFNYVVITEDEWPKVLVVRGKDLFDEEAYGPFTSGTQLREALKIIRKIFPFLDNKSGIKGTDNFYRQLGLAPGGDNLAAYLKNIRHLKLFFSGKKGELVKSLEREMKTAAKRQDFELAQKLRNQLFALKHINDVALIKSDQIKDFVKGEVFRIEAYDIAHTSGRETVGVMTVVEDGEVQKAEYRKFKIRGTTVKIPSEKVLGSPRFARPDFSIRNFDSRVSINDTANLAEVLERRANHPEWPMPNLIVVDGGKAQLNQAVKTLREVGFEVPVVSVVKDDKHRARGLLGDAVLVKKHEAEILLANSEAHRYALAYHRSRRDKVI